MKLAFLDTETTGLDPERHEVWEVALILRTDYEDQPDIVKEEMFHWFLPLTRFETADPFAVKIGRLMERHPQYADNPGDNGVMPLGSFSKEFCKLTDGAHIVGAVPSFDTVRLERLLNKFYHPVLWNYHLIDVENLIAGLFHLQPPYKSTDLSERIGINPDDYDRHTAMGDCLWVRDMYDTVMMIK